MTDASRTIGDLMAWSAEHHGDRTAFRHLSADGAWEGQTFAGLWEQVTRLAGGLEALGIRPGDRVAVLADTRPEWGAAAHAIFAAGAVLVTVYPSSSLRQCEHILSHSQAVAIFVEDERQATKIAEIAPRLPHLRHRISFADVGAIDLGELADRCPDAGPRLAGRTREPSDTAILMYTSGTTGPAKGCVLSHANYRSVTTMVRAQDVLRTGETAFLYLPLAHAFGVLALFMAADVGATIAFWDRRPDRILEVLRQARPHYLPTVPRMLEKVQGTIVAGLEPSRVTELVASGLPGAGPDHGAAAAALREEAEARLFAPTRALLGGRLRACVLGGAPSSRALVEFYAGAGILLLEGYGMTETSSGAVCNFAGDWRLGSVGKPLPGVEMRLAPDAEIELRGPNVFVEYHKDPAATQAAFDDGWLRTGDLGRIDDDGFLHVVGRKKDIIITAGGKNVAPAPLEGIIMQTPEIAHAVVVGERRPYLVVLVTLEEDARQDLADRTGASAEDVHEHALVQALVQAAVDRANAQVSQAEAIKKFAVLGTPLSAERGELTPSHKVRRSAVAEHRPDVIAALYGGPGA